MYVRGEKSTSENNKSLLCMLNALACGKTRQREPQAGIAHGRSKSEGQVSKEWCLNKGVYFPRNLEESRKDAQNP